MSRLGKLPIKLPTGTTASFDKDIVTVKGPKGELKQDVKGLVKVEVSSEEIRVAVENTKNKKEKAFWGLFWSLIRNMVEGVNNGYEKKLEINGVGYKVALSGKNLTLHVGFSHQVDFEIPEGIIAKVEKNLITISGIDKQLVGETAARIRKIKKPEPYKGKGIKYLDEVIIRKEGKTAGKE